MKQINQGDIYWVNLNPIKGHEQAGVRPVLVMQNNILNRHLNTVVVAPLTSNLEAKGLMTTYFLPAKKTELKKDSIVLLNQMRAVDKRRLVKEAGHVRKSDFTQIRPKMLQIFY
jgi:mRNA interferase MazF